MKIFFAGTGGNRECRELHIKYKNERLFSFFTVIRDEFNAQKDFDEYHREVTQEKKGA